VIPLSSQALRVQIPIGRKAVRTRLLVAGKEVRTRYEGDVLQLEVPEIGVHEVVAIDFAT
jgi:hypothetical protein